MNSVVNHWEWNRILGFSLLSLYLGKSIHYLQQLIVLDSLEIEIAFSTAMLGLITLTVYYFTSFRATSILTLFLPVYILYHSLETAFFSGAIQWAYLPEHALQVGLPLLFVVQSYSTVHHQKILYVLVIATALTFLGHGILALGLFHAVPGNFLEMTSNFFQCSHQTAVLFLFIWGVLDLLVIVMLFVPVLRKYALLYMFVWGTLTAMARVVAYWNVGLADALYYKSGGMIFRLLHGLIPLYLYINRKHIKL